MARRKNKKSRAIDERRYDVGEIHDEREYGFFWYAWAWSGIRKVLIALCAVLAAAGIVSVAAEKIYGKLFAATEPGNSEPVEFTIESGSSVSRVAGDLEKAGLLRKDFVFKYLVQFRGLTNSIRYGSYVLNRSMDALDLVDELTGGIDTREVTITVVPGWTVEDIARYLVRTGLIRSAEEFTGACVSADAYRGRCYLLDQAADAGTLKGRAYALEGYLAPDTYRVFATADAASVAVTLMLQTNKVVDSVFYPNTYDYIIDGDGELKERERYESSLTEDETLILASLIEKEAADRKDYAKVSAVYHNRLKAGMKLESNASAAYRTGETGYILSDAAKSNDNPYNTFIRKGLPAGPVCNPSKAAIEAALYPDLDLIAANYLYFCPGEAGKKDLVFARSLQEYRANVERYRAGWEAYDRARSRAPEGNS